MSATLDRIRTLPHVEHVDDERELGNGIIITLKPGYTFQADPGCGVRGFDNVREAAEGTRKSAVIQPRSAGSH